MNKTELVTKVAGKTDLPRKDVEKVMNEMLNSIVDALEGGDKVQLVGFGSFENRERKARVGKNPATGENIYVPAAHVPAFRPGKTFRDNLN